MSDINDWLKLVMEIPGERRRFHAPSRSSSGHYLVDLEANNFEGECGCPDHQMRKHRCWHIKLIMVYWYDKTIREQAAADNPGVKEYIGA
jgi:hypothetical protein